MEIISEEIIEENGVQYKLTTYDNGYIVKELYEPNPPDPIPEPLPELSDIDSAILETAANTEYLVAMSELSM